MRNPEAISECIRSAKRIVVCSHVNPDGDTIGSALAITCALKSVGKEVRVFCQDKVPNNLMFLPGAESIEIPTDCEVSYDLFLAVDVSDPARLGTCAELLKKAPRSAQIDHHGTNPMFADVNSVDGDAAATCVMIYEQIRSLGIEITKDIAMCLYTGISTDTGNFSFGCTNAEAFRIMSELMGFGLPLSKMNRKLFRVREKAQLLLIGKAISGMEFLHNGELAVMKLTRKDFEECGARSEHADTIVNFGMDTIGTKMSLLARETEDDTIKFSLRALEPLCVDGIANRLGGGGHAQASGISIRGTLEETTAVVTNAMLKALDEQKA